jgi:hypothetical protein
MILITVAPVGYRGSWSASIDDRIICPSVRWPFVAAAKALLAEGHAPETEIAMKHQGSTIVAMRQDRHPRGPHGWPVGAPNGLAGRRSRRGGRALPETDDGRS